MVPCKIMQAASEVQPLIVRLWCGNFQMCVWMHCAAFNSFCIYWRSTTIRLPHQTACFIQLIQSLQLRQVQIAHIYESFLKLFLYQFLQCRPPKSIKADQLCCVTVIILTKAEPSWNFMRVLDQAHVSLTYHCRQENHYLSNPGNLLTVNVGKNIP